MTQEEQEDSQYMQRREPRKPSREEQFGLNRLSYGYKGKQLRAAINDREIIQPEDVMAVGEEDDQEDTK